MALFQQLFSNRSKAGHAGQPQALDADVQLSAPRELDAAEVAAVAGGPIVQNDDI